MWNSRLGAVGAGANSAYKLLTFSRVYNYTKLAQLLEEFDKITFYASLNAMQSITSSGGRYSVEMFSAVVGLAIQWTSLDLASCQENVEARSIKTQISKCGVEELDWPQPDRTPLEWIRTQTENQAMSATIGAAGYWLTGGWCHHKWPPWNSHGSTGVWGHLYMTAPPTSEVVFSCTGKRYKLSRVE